MIFVTLFSTLAVVFLGHRSIFYVVCDQEGGLKISRTATVDGFIYDDGFGGCSFSGCGELLALNAFKFLEKEVTKPAEYGFPKEPGKYRFFLALKGSPECEAYEGELRAHPFAKIRLLPKEKCIGIKEVAMFESQFRYSRHEPPHIGPFGIRKETSKVTYVRTNEVIASASSLYYIGPITLDFTASGDAPACHSNSHSELLHAALRPTRTP